MLDLLWLKIYEKKSSIYEAYRHFDVDFNNRVSFAEFQKGLDHMRIKFTTDQMLSIFNYLDKDQKGFINYTDFCEMAEERRRKLD